MSSSWTRRQSLAAVGALIAAPGLAAVGARAQGAAGEVTVFAAASLQNALDAAAKAYEAHGGGKVKASYAASSVLARQIAAGAPADLFISADADWMNEVEAKGLIAPGSRRNLLTNRLALIAPTGALVQVRIGPGLQLAPALAGGRLAMAGPDVPAGRYGEAALRALGAWPQVQDRLARGENVRATLELVARGEAPLGVVYDTDARIEPRVRIVGLFPEESHPPIVYPMALLKDARQPQSGAFARFLVGPAARSVFRRFGFSMA